MSKINLLINKKIHSKHLQNTLISVNAYKSKMQTQYDGIKDFDNIDENSLLSLVLKNNQHNELLTRNANSLKE